MQGVVAVLSGQSHLSKRQIEELRDEFFGIEMGLGTVSALEQATSQVLEAPVTEVHAAVKEQAVANVDETGWREGNRKAWLWVIVTQVGTMFLLRLSRGAQVAKELLSEAFGGIVGTDRWSGYNFLATERRQVSFRTPVTSFRGLRRSGGRLIPNCV